MLVLSFAETSDRLKLSLVLGVFSCLLIGWDTGLIHRRDLVGVVLQVVVLGGCVAAWWFGLRGDRSGVDRVRS